MNLFVFIFTESHLTSDLKICRIDKHIGSCRGGEEVFIFVEKVSKSECYQVLNICLLNRMVVSITLLTTHTHTQLVIKHYL